MTLTIPIFRYPEHDALTISIHNAVARVMASNWYVLGEEVSEFEAQFSAYCGSLHCISVANGTDALELALKALGVGAGDHVLLAANAGFYGSTAVHLVGAIPVYLDICPVSLTLSSERIQAILEVGKKPAAIIVTHLYGQLADIENIISIADAHGVPVIEDCAQSHGAKRNGKRAGSSGAIGCFSFYPTKNLGALGDGGAIVTNDAAIFERLASLRQYGWNTKYRNNLPGGRNSRLDEIQAAVLQVKLQYLDQWNAERREIARFYNKAFAGLPVQCPSSLDEDYVAHLYVLRLKERDALHAFLKQSDIGCDIHYPVPDHLQAAYANPMKRGDLPNTEIACAEVISLPCFPGLKQSELDAVTRAVHHFFEQKAS